MIVLNETKMSALDLYDYARRHRLVPSDAIDAVTTFSNLAGSGRIFNLVLDDTILGVAIVTQTAHGIAAIDLIPEPKKITNDFVDALGAEVAGLVARLVDEGYRRISASVPESRKKAIRIFRAAGFLREGTLRAAWQSQGRAPEDVLIFGFVAEGAKG